MNITWVTRSFLDYRIPIYKEINRLCGGKLTVIFFVEVVPERCQVKLKKILGDRAIGMSGEIRLLGKKSQAVSNIKKSGYRIPLQPGLIKAVRKSNPDLIISDGFFQWTYAALYLRLVKRIPHLMCYECTKHTERNTDQFRTLYRKIASKLIDRIACNGSLSQEYVESLGYNSCKISLGNMAADSESLCSAVRSLPVSFKKDFKTKLGLSGKVLLFVGRLVSLKGVDKIIQIWSDTFTNNDDINLLLVGDGPEEDSLKKAIRIGNINNVYFTGSIDYDEIHNYFGIADAFIIPTLQDNWSLVVPEAMACGLPIICSKYNGCWPELVKEENGWVFDPLDQENSTQTLKKAIDNKEKWEEMGKASSEIVKNYSPSIIAGSIYNACLKTVSK